MGGFLHFVETGAESLSLDQCVRLGLGHALTKSPTCRKSQLELDGPPVAGLLIYDRDDFNADQGVSVANQRWRYRGESDGNRVWTGYNADDEPTPDGLSLGRTLGSIPWADAQGREWRLPRVGDVGDAGEHEPALPRSMGFDAAGQPTRGEVVARYRQLWDASGPLWATMVETKTCDTAEAAVFATQCFAALYRVSHVELDLLGVFSEESQHSPEVYAAAAVGYFAYAQWEAAKERDPLSVSGATTASDTTGGNAA